VFGEVAVIVKLAPEFVFQDINFFASSNVILASQDFR
jgi:hypothetical protein